MIQYLLTLYLFGFILFAAMILYWLISSLRLSKKEAEIEKLMIKKGLK